MRPIWIDPSTTVLPSFNGSQPFTPLICLSASKQIKEGLERRQNAFTYVQGSGDDHELWGRYATFRSHETSPSQHSSRGLIPDIFWSSRSTLLATPRHDLESVIDVLVDSKTLDESGLVEPGRTSALKPVHPVHGRLLSGVVSELPDPPPQFPTTSEGLARQVAYVLITPHSPNQPPVEEDEGSGHQSILRMSLPAAVSAHSNNLLYNILPKAIPFIREHLTVGGDVCVACPTGKDLGPGVIVTALSLFFGDDGNLLLPPDDTDNKGKPAGQ